MRDVLAIVTGLFCVISVAAQDATTQQQGESNRAVALTSPARSTLSAGEKFKYNLKETFDGQAWLRSLAGAGIDQWYGTPDTWPRNLEGFGDRVGDKIGQRFTKNMLMASTQALLHEDPRPIKPTATGVWPRTRQAIFHTFETRTDSGRTTVNVARFVGAYGDAFISRSWMPAGYRSPKDALLDGTWSLGIDAGFSVFNEFWPDLKSRVFHRH